jgi:hypothetical protein
VKWLKGYAIGCLIVMFVLAGVDGYKGGPGHSVGSIIVMAAAWPIVITFAVGSTIGEVARCGTHDPACAGRSGAAPS